MIEIKPEAKKTDGITNDLVEITQPSIEKMIYVIRDKQVMLDSDLAILYQVETGALNRAVKRNISRFPEDFRFQLTKEEYQNLRCQTGISSFAQGENNYGGRRTLPYVFTEQGISMLASVLHSEVAIKVSIGIMRAFVEMRRFIANNALLFERISNAELKQLEYQKENLLKKKNSLGLKIYNYSKIIQKEIPCCERNKTAPNMPVIKTENSKMDVKWYIAACIAVLEFISGFMPWVSLYYADLFQGQTISCAGIFDLLNDISKFQDWTNSTPEVLGVFVFIIMFGFVMLFINGYFIAQVLQKKESEVSGTIAGISGIVVSVAILLYKWNLDISMEEDNWKWISINTQVGVWLMLLAGIALICVIVFYKSDTEAETKNKPNLEFEVMNYDPVLPIRMKTLKIRKENGKLILELTYAEFEWASIEEFIVDIQLVRYDGTVNTFAQNALFEKKGQNFARFQLQDAGYDLDSIASARVNILGYNIYKSLKKYEEKGSGFSAYSDYSVDELRSARFANSNMVMCMERNIGENHQCCCGQVYSNKNNKCPLCGKERRGK